MSAAATNIVRVVFPGDRCRAAGQIICRIGAHVELKVEDLELFCFRQLTVRDEELVYLAGVIAFADRKIRRSADGWKRKIHIVMPVAHPRTWGRSEFLSALTEALRFATGDAWSFEFTRRKGSLPHPRLPQLSLDGNGTFVVIPFSNGLDSFSQARLLASDGYTATPIRVTAWNRGLGGSRDWVQDTNSYGGRHRRVSVPVRIIPGPGADQTYRTRTFVFSILAGLAAHLSGAGTLVIPEAGQGSFGPSLLPLGGESPHRGSHPGFSRRMERLFETFWDASINMHHPQVWKTKGQVLTELKQKGLAKGWEATRSCSRGPRDLRSGLPCGICSGCLLRRMSLFAAGLGSDKSGYLWNDLNSSTIEASAIQELKRPVSINDRDIAVHAVLAMENLAREADVLSNDPRHQQSLFDAFGHDPKTFKEAQTKLPQLLQSHRKEWRDFTASLAPDSWINQQIAAL